MSYVLLPITILLAHYIKLIQENLVSYAKNARMAGMNLVFDVSPTTLLAIYGSVLSTITVVILVLKYRKDKPLIRVKVSQGFYADMRFDDKTKIILEAVNLGQRPVTLTSAGFALSNKEHIVILKPEPYELPFEIFEGKKYTTMINKDEIFKKLKDRKLSIKYAWFVDATGKEYRVRFGIKG